MLFENPIDLVVGRKTTLARCLEAVIDPGKLCWCGSVLAGHEAGIDFKRDLRKLGLASSGHFSARSRTSLRSLAVMTAA
ncbi:MAG TPA: hypothetical protein VK526_15960 [Bradyrhizobium sp.]|nr:hypothetical protein [Bradyrhizobium sp.]